MTDNLPPHLTLAVDCWFRERTGLGGCSDKDVSELAEIFYGVQFDGGRESVDDAMAIVEYFGPGISGLNDTFARQVLLAAEVKRLRAALAQAQSCVPALWAIHVPGPDDYYPAPSEEAANHMVSKHNAAMTEWFKANPDTSGNRPPIESSLASAQRWPGSAADHAEEIAVFDYAAWGLASPQPQSVQPSTCTCTWTYQNDDSGNYESSCGELWHFIDGGPNENRVTYCHHCGKPVAVKED